MAAGMSVDYVVHMAHAALTQLRDEPSTAVLVKHMLSYALDNAGASVLKGATSTFLGICVLSVAPNMVFRMFFKLLFGIVVAGVSAGFIFFPSGATLCLFAKRTLHRWLFRCRQYGH